MVKLHGRQYSSKLLPRLMNSSGLQLFHTLFQLHSSSLISTPLLQCLPFLLISSPKRKCFLPSAPYLLPIPYSHSQAHVYGKNYIHKMIVFCLNHSVHTVLVKHTIQMKRHLPSSEVSNQARHMKLILNGKSNALTLAEYFV